jgi:hypothetical protein
MQDFAPCITERTLTILGRRAGIMQGGYFLRRLFPVTKTLAHLGADVCVFLQPFLPSSQMDEMPTLRQVCLAIDRPKTLENWRISKSGSYFHNSSSRTAFGTAIALSDG